jgi:hypothetical protein
MPVHALRAAQVKNKGIDGSGLRIFRLRRTREGRVRQATAARINYTGNPSMAAPIPRHGQQCSRAAHDRATVDERAKTWLMALRKTVRINVTFRALGDALEGEKGEIYANALSHKQQVNLLPKRKGGTLWIFELTGIAVLPCLA